MRNSHHHIARTLSVLVLVSLLSADPAFSQLRFGLKGGPVISRLNAKFNGGTDVKVKAKIGFHVGFALGYDIGPLTIRSGADFTNGGGLFNGTRFLAEEAFEVNYITVPVDLRLHVTREGHLRPYFFAGPEWRFLLNMEDKLNLRDDLGLVSAAASAGFGVTFDVPWFPVKFSPEIRFVWDLNGFYEGELQTDDGGVVTTAEAIRTNALKAGLLLGL